MSHTDARQKLVLMKVIEIHFVGVDGRLSDEEAIEKALRGEGEITSPYPQTREAKVIKGGDEDDE